MDQNPVYTIGHGNLPVEEFITRLEQYGVQTLVDVRSIPYSDLCPEFNRVNLELYLQKVSIQYVYMGDTLGGFPKNGSCYNKEGKVDYNILITKEFFLAGMHLLCNEYYKNGTLVLMGSEVNPVDCHRSKLIGRELQDRNFEVLHITPNGRVKTQSVVMLETTKGMPVMDLFGNTANFNSEKKYKY